MLHLDPPCILNHVAWSGLVLTCPAISGTDWTPDGLDGCFPTNFMAPLPKFGHSTGRSEQKTEDDFVKVQGVYFPGKFSNVGFIMLEL